MIEKIVSRRNIQEAIKQVVSNQGSAGVDGRSVKTLTSYMKTNWNALATAVISIPREAAMDLANASASPAVGL